MKRQLLKLPTLFVIIAGTVIFAIGIPKATKTDRHTIQTLPPEVADRTDNLNDRFWLYLPERYKQASKEKPMPLIIYLHGSSRRGRDVAEVKVNGLAHFIDKRDDFEFVVVSPQALSKHPWQTCWQPDDLIILLVHLLTNYHLDPKRVYLTGLSMGGYGTWAAIGKHADRFAAAAPICGGGNPASAKSIGKLPVWAFHGDDDLVVSVERSHEMVDAIKTAKGNAKLTVYPGVGHDSYTRTYANPNLYEWFLKHKRP
ncbi:prolyl oligopeptidase family serine peptidase [bacterium]|nr:prolyl oligopeptidase family serine peptidase [bacterium]